MPPVHGKHLVYTAKFVQFVRYACYVQETSVRRAAPAWESRHGEWHRRGGGRPLEVTRLLDGPVTPGLVTEPLRDAIDPELGINIVDLGLVYDVAVDEAAITVTMTLTTPGCPLSTYLDDEVAASLSRLPGSWEVPVRLVWEPRWEPAMMTDAAEAALG